jgi:hypothetical protein
MAVWDLEEEAWTDAGEQPTDDDFNGGNNGVNSNTYGEQYTSIYYFNTADGETWAFHAFVHADDVNERYPDPWTYQGDSALYRWEGSNFEDEPTYRIYSQQASTRTVFFTTPEGREYLWTANFALPYTRSGTPNCTLHEYGNGAGDGGDDNNGGWYQVNYNNGNGNNGNFGYFNCSKFPRSPLVFTNVEDEWLYLDVAYATATWRTDGTLATTSTANVPQTKWMTQRTTTGSNYDFDYTDIMDNLAFTNVNTVDHFVSAGFDYLVAMTDTGLSTWRMHWVTHRAQVLPALRITPAPTHVHLFDYLEHTCASVSTGPYSGLNQATPNPWDNFFNIYCWDPVHDRWNLVIKVPAFGVIKTQTFTQQDGDDTRLFLVALQNEGHPTMNTFTTYEFQEWYDEDFRIVREEEPSGYETYQRIIEIHEVLDDLYHYKAMIIATLSLLATVFVLQLVLVAKGMSGGGGGGSGDYQSFS